MSDIKICRYCNKEIANGEGSKTFSYWSAIKFDCHKNCKKMGEALEAWECQSIDANCNYCKYLKRTSSSSGVCKKMFCDQFEQKQLFYPNGCLGRKCFVPRKPRPQYPVKISHQWEFGLNHLWIGCYWEKWETYDTWRRDIWISIPFVALRIIQESNNV
jgi:hypothetical protein